MQLLWWLIPKTLAGMPAPKVHPKRRLAEGGSVEAFDDEFAILHSAGIRAVVTLLNIPTDGPVYESAGFAHLCLPIPDGGAPTFPQAKQFVDFVERQRAAGRAVAVHCQAGIGRTGTMLAVYLISQGESAMEAVRSVREAEPCAIETRRQVQFLEQYAEKRRSTSR